ncbi:hypothetical protein C0431_15555 [bacterium]|jgi:hypothetical protein|nr:hypothetical protein [bacterium]
MTQKPLAPIPADRIAKTFIEHYTKLAQTIADANQYGQSPGLETQYTAERSWMLHNYRFIKKQLTQHLPEAPKALTWTKPLDAFEQLFQSPTLTQLLHQDDRTVRDLLQLTQTAVKQAFHLTEPSKLAVS